MDVNMMGANMTASNQSRTSPWMTWPLPPWFFDRALRSMSGIFDQPINQGWSFANLTINAQNSSAPDTERDIVAAESYGRQLGRVMDALAALIAKQPQLVQKEPALQELIDLRKKIEEIKTQAAMRHIDHLAADLVRLKNEDMPEYQRLVTKLREVLSDQS